MLSAGQVREPCSKKKVPKKPPNTYLLLLAWLYLFFFWNGLGELSEASTNHRLELVQKNRFLELSRNTYLLID